MHEPAQPTRADRLRARAHRKVRAVRKFTFGLTNTAHPLLVHIIPIRRCNIDCGYCNEYDKVSQPVPCTKPPSICPRSIIGERESPTSCTMSTRRTT